MIGKLKIFEYELTNERQKNLDEYVLQKDVFGLKKGTIFVYDAEDHIKKSYIYGTLKLAWTKENWQQGWAGGAFILPGRLKDNEEWFKRRTVDKFKSKIKEKLLELANMIDDL